MVLELEAFLEVFGAEARARGFRARTLCETGAGPVVVWERGGEGMSRYLSAGIHGDEPAGPLAALELLKSGAFDGGCWRLCPALNPTGLAAGTRDTVDGIDLNRDYWRRRSREVRAHADWLESQATPSVFLSLHEDWEYPGFYFYEINLGDDRPERAEAIRAAVGPWLPVENSTMIDGHEVREPGWIFHAAEADLAEQWPEAIFLAKRGCPLSFTYETPTGSPLATRIGAHVAGVHAVLRGEDAV